MHTKGYSAPETMQRLLAALAKRDLTVFARIDHAANAGAVGMPLPGLMWRRRLRLFA